MNAVREAILREEGRYCEEHDSARWPRPTQCGGNADPGASCEAQHAAPTGCGCVYDEHDPWCLGPTPVNAEQRQDGEMP